MKKLLTPVLVAAFGLASGAAVADEMASTTNNMQGQNAEMQTQGGAMQNDHMQGKHAQGQAAPQGNMQGQNSQMQNNGKMDNTAPAGQ